MSPSIKDPFHIAPKEPISGIPGEVLKRCFGKQTPCTPHAQRLLVAATKEAKAEKKGQGKGKSGKGKPGKGKDKVDETKVAKPGKGKGDGVANQTVDDEPVTPPSVPEGAAEVKKRKKTPYAEAKDAYIERPLGLPSFWSNVFF